MKDERRRSSSMARFRAMGTEVEVHCVGSDDDAVGAARSAIDGLERRWSRFIPTSEVCRLNECAGFPTVVSDETYELVSLAVEGWRITGGLFDPTLLDALVRAGYDRSFERLDPVGDEGEDGFTPSTTGRRDLVGRSLASGIVLEPSLPAVTLPSGARFDAGGIGKGLAADIVVDSMMRSGAAGACVNVGGDLRCAGAPPVGDEWIIAIEDPFGGPPVCSLLFDGGGVATSARTKRVWSKDGRAQHHLIDPATERPAACAASATVVADDAWLAEVLAKAMLLADEQDAFDLLHAHGCTGLIVGNDGRVRPDRAMEGMIA